MCNRHAYFINCFVFVPLLDFATYINRDVIFIRLSMTDILWYTNVGLLLSTCGSVS